MLSNFQKDHMACKTIIVTICCFSFFFFIESLPAPLYLSVSDFVLVIDTTPTVNALIMLTEYMFHNSCVLLLPIQPQSELGPHSLQGTWTSSWICLHWCSWPPWGSWQWGRGAALRGTSRWRRPSRGNAVHLRWPCTAPGGESRVMNMELMWAVPEYILACMHARLLQSCPTFCDPTRLLCP